MSITVFGRSKFEKNQSELTYCFPLIISTLKRGFET